MNRTNNETKERRAKWGCMSFIAIALIFSLFWVKCFNDVIDDLTNSISKFNNKTTELVENNEPQGLYKYYEGEYFGDVIQFIDNGHYVRNDTIFIDDNAIAVLIKRSRQLDGERFIIIKDLSSSRATYIHK